MILVNHRPSILHFEQHMILGSYPMTKAEWEKMKDHPTIKAMVDEGILEPKLEDHEQADRDLSDLSPKDAIEAVKLCVVREDLEAFAKSEKRAGVLKAIKQQLIDIERTPEEKGEKKKEE